MFSRFGLPSQVENWGKNVSLLRWRSKLISSGFPYKAPCGKSLMLLELKSSCESFFSDEISGNVWRLFRFSSKIFKFGIFEKAFLGTSWIAFLLKSRSCRSGQYAVLKGHVSSPWLDRSITLWLQSTSISPAWSCPSAWPSRFWSKRNESIESSFSKQCWRSESANVHAFKRKKAIQHHLKQNPLLQRTMALKLQADFCSRHLTSPRFHGLQILSQTKLSSDRIVNSSTGTTWNWNYFVAGFAKCIVMLNGWPCWIDSTLLLTRNRSCSAQLGNKYMPHESALQF